MEQSYRGLIEDTTTELQSGQPNPEPRFLPTQHVTTSSCVCMHVSVNTAQVSSMPGCVAMHVI